ncbi:MAG: hypothetical protein JKY93_12915 [Gammaproteobacteria bacterium]|nr:hypothetical protein [Gammaproteobacteria bacterium]
MNNTIRYIVPLFVGVAIAGWFGGIGWAIGIGIVLSIGAIGVFFDEKKEEKTSASPSDKVPAIKKTPKKSIPSKPITILDTVEMSYRDRQGNETTRVVDLITGIRGDSFRAFCHSKEAERTFYFDQIIGDVTRVETGEALPNDVWRKELRKIKR